MKKGSLRGIDVALLEGIRDRDNVIMEQVYEDCFPGIRRFVFSQNGSLDDAHDLFQDALIVVFKKCRTGDFELTCTLKTYLQAICRRMWLNKKSRGKGVFMSDVTEMEQDIVIEEEITTSFHRQERERVYREYFQKLGADCQNILKAFLEGIKMKEIARRFQIPSEGAAKKRKFTCQKRLMDWIRNDTRYSELRFDQ
ncbi:MAG: sigma-70 family RNA polymerase sigma factor [Bacteroidota bacterium]